MENYNFKGLWIFSELKRGKDTLFRWIKDPYLVIVFILILFYTTLFSSYTILKHKAFLTSAWDLGIYTQSLWTTIKHHRIFYYTIENPEGQSFLRMHASLILFLLLPIYAIYPNPETLLLIQSFILALGALPLYLIANVELKNKKVSTLISASYLLYPALHGVNQFDFHVEAFIPVFFFFAYYFYIRDNWKFYFLFLILSLLCIEFVPFIVIAFALYQFLLTEIFILRRRFDHVIFKKKLACSVATLILGAAFLLIDSWVLGAFNPSQDPTFLLVSRLSHRIIGGGSFLDIFLNIFGDPEGTLLALLSDWQKKFDYLINLLGPLMFIPFFDPFSLIPVVPWIGASFITYWGAYYSIYYQYSSFIIPFLFISTVNGIKRISGQYSISDHVLKKISIGILICTLIFSSYLSVLSPINPHSGNPQNPFNSNWWPEITEHARFLNYVISLIPRDSSVLTQVEIIPHLSDRLFVYAFVTDTSPRPDFILIDPSLKSYKSIFIGGFLGATPSAQKLIHDGDYGLYAMIDGALLYRRGYEGSLKFFIPKIDVFNYKDLILSNGKVVRDDTSISGRVISSNKDDSKGIVWFGPYKHFIPGKYVATFRLKTESENFRFLLDIVTNKGKEYISVRTIFGSDFVRKGDWQDFSIYFEINEIMELEFRGLCLTNNVEIFLDYIKVEQITP